MVTIYGKDSCPYTRAARDDFETRGEVLYVNVRKDPDGLRKMLVHSQGRRVVPVIVEADGTVTIGWDGGT